MSGEHADCSIEEPEPEEGCCASETERKTASCNNSPSAMNCANMNGCFWVDGADADCSWQEEDDLFLFAGEGVTEAMNSQVSLSTLLLCLVCAFALWKVYGWWSNGGDA